MNDKEILRNKIIAEEVFYFKDTVCVICDERPGFEIEQARRVIAFLRENGYYVRELTVDEFCSLSKVRLGFLVIIPHACSLPGICSPALKAYIESGGSILTFGGVLFGKYVDRVDGKWTEIPLPQNIFDSVHTGDGSKPKSEPIVIEGIVPTYKTYRCNDAREFENNGFYCSENVYTDKPLRVVCPVARPYGGGANMDFRNRLIPFSSIRGSSDRGDGSEGIMAFIMLSDTSGHDPAMVGLSYPGTVGYTARGSVAAGIGITEQNLMDIKGVPELILSIVSNIRTGLHIFNAGAERYVYSDGENAVFAAKIHSSSIDYEYVTVRISVLDGKKTVYCFEKEIICVPTVYSEVRFDCPDFKAGEYIVETELIYNGKIIDKASQEIHKKKSFRAASRDEFVRVEGDNFILNGKLWYPAGMNYWPLYMPGFERTHYWLSWLDKSNYIPEEIEKDLALMEKMGINCLFIRIDGDFFGRQRDTFEDFLLKCERHNMKLSFSFCNITAPVHYNGRAFRTLLEEFELKDNPIIFSYDISWESDGSLLATEYKRRYDDEWEKWLVDRYGSVENAQENFGVEIDRREDGNITVPEETEFANEGKWRVKICAYRRFMQDYFGSLWKTAVYDMRRADSNHLITYRRGPMGLHCKGVKIASKYLDYNSHEAYHIGLDDIGYHEACANAAYFKFISGNKPLIWSEFGYTLTGMNRTHDFMWDHETERPAAYRVKLTEDYNNMIQDILRRTGAKGTAPWWWPGGLRMVEMSDCGYCGPDGILRQFGRDYAKFISEYYKSAKKVHPPEYPVKIDLDSTCLGDTGLCHYYLAEEDKKAEKLGCVMSLFTEATGKTSADVALTAVGNVPYNGKNPPKYLNGEFNYITVFSADGREIQVQNGDTVPVSPGPVFIKAGLGNLGEAKWLSPLKREDTFGAVYVVSHPSSELEIKIPIAADAGFEEDTETERTLLFNDISERKEIALRLSADRRAEFGEVFRFLLVPGSI